MSLDIKVKRKNVPPVVMGKIPPVKPPVQNINIGKAPESLPSEPAIKTKKYGYGWWILFIILVLLFSGVIYIIWNEQSKPTENISTKKDKSAGIVSTFVPDGRPPENVPPPTESALFSMGVINNAISDFTDKLFLYKQKVKATSTEDISLTATDVYETAQHTQATLREQYAFLQQSIDQVVTASSLEIYTSQIDDYIKRIEGEFNIIATLIDLESETSFSPEIEISFEKLDKYFQEIENLIQIINEELNPDLELIINDNISTTTTLSTTTEIQATTTTQ